MPPKPTRASADVRDSCVRGANVNCRAWLMDDSNRSTGGRFRPQAWPPLSAVSDNWLGTQHSAVWPRRRVVVLQRQTQIVCRYSTTPACTAQAATRRHFAIRSQRRARSARYKDGSSGGALRRDGIFKHEFVANLLPSPSVEMLQNRLIIDELTGKSLVSCFFWLTVYIQVYRLCYPRRRLWRNVRPASQRRAPSCKSCSSVFCSPRQRLSRFFARRHICSSTFLFSNI